METSGTLSYEVRAAIFRNRLALAADQVAADMRLIERLRAVRQNEKIPCEGIYEKSNTERKETVAV